MRDKKYESSSMMIHFPENKVIIILQGAHVGMATYTALDMVLAQQH